MVGERGTDLVCEYENLGVPWALDDGLTHMIQRQRAWTSLSELI